MGHPAERRALKARVAKEAKVAKECADGDRGSADALRMRRKKTRSAVNSRDGDGRAVIVNDPIVMAEVIRRNGKSIALVLMRLVSSNEFEARNTVANI